MSTDNHLLRRGLIAVLMAACLALLVAACGSSSSSESSGSSSSESASSESGASETTSSESGGGESLQGKKVVYVACGDQNQWCRAGNHKIIDELEAKGAEVTYLQDPYDPVLQVQHLNEAIAQKPDLIVLLATDAKAVIPTLRKAQAAGIPVINIVGPDVPESKPYYAASIIVNHTELGENAAKLLVKGLQEEGKKSGDVFVITGAQVQPEVAIRLEAFEKVMAEHPEYKIVSVQDGEWDQVKSAEIAQQLFAKYGKSIVGAYGMADQQAAGIIQAAEQAGLKVGEENGGIIVVGSNCFKIGMENIAKGKEYGTSTEAAYKVAEFVTPYLVEYLEGKEIPKEALSKEYPIDKGNLKEWKAACSVA